MTEQGELTDLAADAYVYGYPMVSDLSMVEAFMYEGVGLLAPNALQPFRARLPTCRARHALRAGRSGGGIHVVTNPDRLSHVGARTEAH